MNYKVYYDGNNCYYKNELGNIVSGPYSNAHDFDEYGIALIRDSDDFYYINKKFEKISRPYYYAGEFFTVGNKRMAVTKENGDDLWYFIDQDFKKISPAFDSLLGTLYTSEYYNSGEIPFMTLRTFDFFLDLNFQKVGPKYHHIETPFYYFPTLDENCAEVDELVDGKYLHYLINEDFVKITHGVENRPHKWSEYIKHIIPDKIKSKKTYSRMLNGELITPELQNNDTQLEETSNNAKSIGEIVKNDSLHRVNLTTMTENKTISKSTSAVLEQSKNIASKGNAQQKKESTVEIVKVNALHSDGPKITANSTNKNTHIQQQETQQAKSPQTTKPSAEDITASSPTNCKYTKYRVFPHIVDKYYAFKDENGNRVSDVFDNISDFDECGIAYVRTKTYGLQGGDTYYFYINTNLERISDTYSHACKFYRVGNIDMAVIVDRKDNLHYLINRRFEKISRGYPYIDLGPTLQKNGVPFTQITVRDNHPSWRYGCYYFLDKNLQKVSPEYYYASHFEYFDKEYGEYLAKVKVPGKKDYEYYLINEDFEIVSSELNGNYSMDFWHQHVIPEKVKSNKTYSNAMTGYIKHAVSPMKTHSYNCHEEECDYTECDK